LDILISHSGDFMIGNIGTGVLHQTLMEGLLDRTRFWNQAQLWPM
jgi:hypothetical protein